MNYRETGEAAFLAWPANNLSCLQSPSNKVARLDLHLAEGLGHIVGAVFAGLFGRSHLPPDLMAVVLTLRFVISQTIFSQFVKKDEAGCNGNVLKPIFTLC